MIADVYTLETTYRLQMLGSDGEWWEYSQAEYTSADAVHQLASEIYGGIPRDEYRLIEISRRVIENR